MYFLFVCIKIFVLYSINKSLFKKGALSWSPRLSTCQSKINWILFFALRTAQPLFGFPKINHIETALDIQLYYINKIKINRKLFRNWFSIWLLTTFNILMVNIKISERERRYLTKILRIVPSGCNWEKCQNKLLVTDKVVKSGITWSLVKQLCSAIYTHTFLYILATPQHCVLCMTFSLINLLCACGGIFRLKSHGELAWMMLTV